MFLLMYTYGIFCDPISVYPPLSLPISLSLSLSLVHHFETDNYLQRVFVLTTGLVLSDDVYWAQQL